ncbi:S15/NS1 RNA-binding domain-containing protein, partial [Daedalea quercina L-15889]
RTVASTSSAHGAPLHTTAVLRYTGLSNKEKEAAREAAAKRPHVVLGHRIGDDAKWKNCDLARIIVTEEDILKVPSPPVEARTIQDVRPPEYLNFGVGDKEKQLLFEVLPNLAIEGTVKQKQKSLWDTEQYVAAEDSANEVEAQRTVQFARVVDLRNANAKGILFENKKRIIAAFSGSDDVVDTGRPEVQAAILTVRIRNVWDHLSRQKKDAISRRRLRELVHKRAKVLRYLKRVSLDRYELCLERIGCEPGAVEGELVV